MLRKALSISAIALCLSAAPVLAQTSQPAAGAPTEIQPAPAVELSALQQLLQENRELIEKSSRRTIGPVIRAIARSGLADAPLMLEKWQAREMYQRKADGLFFYADTVKRGTLHIYDFSGTDLGEAPSADFDQLKPNSGIQAEIASALVRFQLTDPDAAKRLAALTAIERNATEGHLAVLAESVDDPDPAIAARKARLLRLLTIRFGENDDARIAAIESFDGDLGLDVRAALNPLVQTRMEAVAGKAPDTPDIARKIKPGSEELSRDAAYALLVDAKLAPPLLTSSDLRGILAANIQNGAVGGIEVASLNTDANRDLAFAELVRQGAAQEATTETEINDLIDAHSFFLRYTAGSPSVIAAAADTLRSIDHRVGLYQLLDLSLDALSLASIYFLAAIGLAITFGVMRVINMAHGEFIMMGAYTGYVIQQLIPNYTVSIIVAIPLAFMVTFAAGVAMERLVIRWLYHRPLETLLATFGISVALQQLAKNIFGTQARPLTSPDWLGGALAFNDVVSISYIRIAIFVMSLVFLCLFLLIMNKTRIGLEVRAVTQNPRMAASMGINPDRINMLTFGLGSGIAGIAGVTIGLYAKVTSELGSDYIVQSFMTVVVGGVGNIWGTLLGATLIGFLQKGIEWFNPSNTLAAQTYMIIFIIIFIQFRPRGIVALKGRAAEA